jgi:S1-C subfamily serine protease
VRSFGYDFGPEAIQIFGARRGRLGVVVNLSADPARDSIGARITGVTPNGPADKAGVQTGDIVVQLNGTRLAPSSGSANEDESNDASPGRRLVELVSRLHTGDTVHLEMRRDGKPVNVTLVAGSSGMEDMTRNFTLRAMPRGEMTLPFEGGTMNLMFAEAPLANLELVKVNAGLAPYFGTSEGVLVVDAPGDSALGLKPGDVILSIGGRKPDNPSHAFRILGTYDPGEAVSFDVMRMKHRVTVTGKMPERRAWRAVPNSFEDFDGLLEPGWEHMDLLKGWDGWIGQELPQLLQTPRLQMLKGLTPPAMNVAPKHRTVSS